MSYRIFLSIGLLFTLALTGCHSTKSQSTGDKVVTNSTESAVSFYEPKAIEVPIDFKSFTFPEYFTIRYPPNWVKSDDSSIPFSTTLWIDSRPVALVYANITKQANFDDYVKTIISNSGKRPIITPTKVGEYPAVEFFLSDESTVIRNLVINKDSNTIIRFCFQHPYSTNFPLEKDIEIMRQSVQVP